MSAKDIESFRELLLLKRREISGDMSAMHDEATGAGDRGGNELSSMPLHMADLGTDNFERELTLGLLEGERAILREIDDALDRIRAGTYGRCMATDKPIGKARLKAQPWAKYCYEYMLEQERGRRFG
ncbi:MAG: TraR/DksA family transcriptional regulator [Phycisphaerae bacterium]